MNDSLEQFRDKLYRVARCRLDYISCIFLSVGGIVIISLYLKSPTIQLLSFGGGIFLGALAYIILIKFKCVETRMVCISDKKYMKCLLEAVFLIFFVLSLAIIHTSQSRSIFYFIVISICIGLVALLCYQAINKTDIVIQILNIYLLSLNIKLTKFYLYEGSGIDYWKHLKMNEILAQFGDIEVLIGKEQYFPIMHISVAINEIILDVSVKDASMYSTIIPLVISSICVYLLGRELFGENIGLLGMLIVNISDYHNLWGISPQTTSYGIIIFFVTMFVLYKSKDKINRIEHLIVLYILIITMILTHAISSFVLLMTLTGLTAGSLIYCKAFSKKREVFSPIILVIYLIALLQHWFIAEFTRDGSSFFDQISGSLIYYLIEHGDILNRPESYPEFQTLLPPLSEQLLNNTGLALLIFLAIIGSIYWLSVNFLSEDTFSILFCTALLLAITFVFPFIGLRNIIPSRWFLFEYFFLAIMAAFAIIQIAHCVKNNREIYVILTFFISLSFFMITNDISNDDNPIWLRDYTRSNTFTAQEIKGAETISRYSDEVFTDSRYGNSIIDVYLGLQHQPLNYRNLSNQIGGIILWREYMDDRPILTFERIEGFYKIIATSVILGPEFKAQLQKMQKVYENGDVEGYYIEDFEKPSQISAAHPAASYGACFAPPQI